MKHALFHHQFECKNQVGNDLLLILHLTYYSCGPSGNVTLNDVSDEFIFSFKLMFHDQIVIVLLHLIFSPSFPDNASLSDKPCFRIYFGSVNDVVVVAVN